MRLFETENWVNERLKRMKPKIALNSRSEPTFNYALQAILTTLLLLFLPRTLKTYLRKD